MMPLKRALLAAIDQPAAGRLLARLRPDRVAILMLHRFASPDGTRTGHDPHKLRSLLGYLRACRIKLVDLDEAVRTTAHGGRFGAPAVAFTVDDCYPDAWEVGAPVFREFDCPVTGFVVPNMVAGEDWFWWDQIDWLLQRAQSRAVSIEVGGKPFSHTWTDAAGAKQVGRALIEAVKLVSTAERRQIVQALAESVDVPLPERVPEAFRVMNWDELKTADAAGFRFGPHTMSHPVLSRSTDEEAAYEIRQSITRVNEVLSNPSRVFCYPVGRVQDFGVREMDIVKSTGMLGAVSAVPRVISTSDAAERTAQWRWAVPRFGYDERDGATARSLLL